MVISFFGCIRCASRNSSPLPLCVVSLLESILTVWYTGSLVRECSSNAPQSNARIFQRRDQHFRLNLFIKQGFPLIIAIMSDVQWLGSWLMAAVGPLYWFQLLEENFHCVISISCRPVIATHSFHYRHCIAYCVIYHFSPVYRFSFSCFVASALFSRTLSIPLKCLGATLNISSALQLCKAAKSQ